MQITSGVDVDAVEARFGARWYALDEDDARAVLAAVRELSDAELLSRPLLLSGAAIALSLLGGEANGAAGGDRASLLERLSVVVDSAARGEGVAQRHPRWLVLRMIAARWRREFERAEELSELLGRSAPGLSARQALLEEGDALARPGQVSLQRGLTSLLVGRMSEAIDQFAAAYRASGPAPYRHFAGVNAAANSAMIAAVDGHDPLAGKWLERVERAGAVPTWCRDLIVIGADIAQLIRDLDVLDVSAATARRDELERAGDRFELWPFQVHALTTYDLAAGQPVRAYERLKQVGFERNFSIVSDPLADHIVFRSYLDTLIAGGEGGLVIRLVEDAGMPLRSLVPVARTRLLSGDAVGAARVSARTMRRALIPPRDMWEATLIHALANLRLGEHDTARNSFHTFLNANPHSLPAILSRQSAQDVEDIYALAGAEPPPLTRHTTPLPTIIVSLTTRERQILQHLVDGRNAQEIAAIDITSTHTVRTHIKSIYRKLGARSRAQAVAIANQHGLVRWHHTDGHMHDMS